MSEWLRRFGPAQLSHVGIRNRLQTVDGSKVQGLLHSGIACLSREEKAVAIDLLDHGAGTATMVVLNVILFVLR